MLRLTKTALLAGIAGMAGIAGIAGFGGVPQAEAAVVYCKTVGVPKGCVVRPAVVAPALAAPRVGVGAPGVGVRPGRVGNRGGPINRVGRR
jgi:hypothetical protein